MALKPEMLAQTGANILEAFNLLLAMCLYASPQRIIVLRAAAIRLRAIFT